MQEHFKSALALYNLKLEIMKKIFQMSCFICMLLLVQLAKAQVITPSKNFINTALQSQILSPQSLLRNNNNASTYSNVQIQQIGNNNNIVSSNRSNNAGINLVQQGNKNQIGLNLSSKTIDENVFQSGYNHSFIDVNSNSSIMHSSNVIQQGANQNLLMYGNNSMANNMFINMRGSNQTVIVRNIKR